MENLTTTNITSSKADNNPSPIQGKRVLVADDNPVNLQLAKSLLSKWEVIVDTAANGYEALEAFKNGQYDCILMDIHMPVMSGLDASRSIREFEKSNHQRTTPIIAFTADVFIEESVFQEMEINTKLYKPFDAKELKHLLTSLILQKSEAEGLPLQEVYRPLQSNLN